MVVGFHLALYCVTDSQPVVAILEFQLIIGTFFCRGGLNGSAPLAGVTFAQLKPSVWQSEFYDAAVSRAHSNT
jgi:hypothetical protein